MPETIHDLIDRALAEDVGAGDLTTEAVVPAEVSAKGRIDQKAPGAIAGLKVAEAVFHRLEPSLRWHSHVDEGEWRTGGLVAEVAGPARAILTGERVALNFLGHLSGVATSTASYVAAVEGTGARILDTRKTTPGLRALEKQAVAVAGGENHRAGLHDAVLVKENHALLAGGVGEAARRALAAAGDLAARRADGGQVEVVVECATLAEVEEALAAGAGRLLLDNMSPEELARAAASIAGSAVIEASGGVRLANVRELAEAGAQLISVGALTHSAEALDLSLGVEPL